MKNLFIFCFLLGSIFLFSQSKKEYVYLKRETDMSRTYKGSVDGNPITIYLEYLTMSDCSQHYYTVKGWYYYDKYKQKIPLHGYYGLELVLYNFENQDKKIEEKFSESYGTGSYISGEVLQLDNYKEKFVFETDWSKNQNIKGSFYFNNKKLDANLFTTDYSIFRENEYLVLPNGKTYNTYDIINSFAGNKLLSVKTDKNENRILLKYNHPSNHNACGFCGADPGEEGYRVLTFDKNWTFKGLAEYPIYSCRESIDSEKITENGKLVHYTVFQNGEQSHHIKIDEENAKVIKFF